ncbi:DUF6653 family protein [Aestuariibius sp. 2305UL40-4]|uniref:DUF6653 family protein n=1 Tax=Aestuariibius violaceus TaxID=3234132 RepID=UPI00345E47A3
MDIFKISERLMSMDDEAWRRHANPISVYTRFTCLPLLVLAIWSRVWLGWWSLIPIALACLWIWFNPRIFGPPDSLDNWASRGVMGERVFLNRHNTHIADHHLRMAKILTAASGVGALILIYGLVVLDVWATICGVIATVGPKVWFVDRMLWILQDHERGEPGPREETSRL